MATTNEKMRFRPVGSSFDLPELEHGVLELWEQDRSFEALRKKNAGGPRYSFIDGPITANRFLPGHRLRIALSGAFHPLFSVNPQTGAQEFESDSTRAGEIRIHSAASIVILPRAPIEPD